MLLSRSLWALFWKFLNALALTFLSLVYFLYVGCSIRFPILDYLKFYIEFFLWFIIMSIEEVLLFMRSLIFLAIFLSFLEKVLDGLKSLTSFKSSIILGAWENVPRLLNKIFLLVWDFGSVLFIILNSLGTCILFALQNY